MTGPDHAVTGGGPHAVDPSDEHRHTPGPGQLWSESYYLDFVADDGRIAGYVRIGLYPNLGVTWWTTMLVGEGRPVVSSVAYDLPVAGGTGLVIDADGVVMHGAVDDPLVTMSLRGTAPGRRLDRPEDVYRGVAGAPTTIALDLAWTTDGVPYHYDLTTRYEVPCLVHGEIAIGDERVTVDGQGQRDHSWGERDWWAFGWCWAAARLDDGTRVHLTDVRIPGHPVAFGYLQSPGPPGPPVAGLAGVAGPGGLTGITGRRRPAGHGARCHRGARPRGPARGGEGQGRAGRARPAHRTVGVRPARAGGTGREDQSVPPGGGPLRRRRRAFRPGVDRVEPA